MVSFKRMSHATTQVFVSSQFPFYACKLHKWSLNGLKQAPRTWFECFTFEPLTFDFVWHILSYLFATLVVLLLTSYCMRMTLFLLGMIFYILILLFLNSCTTLIWLIWKVLHTFLVWKCIKKSTGIFISQEKYIRDVILWFGLPEAKICSTPCSATYLLAASPLCSSHDASTFRSIVGTIHY